jgi:methionyl-tRNA formyltransferase
MSLKIVVMMTNENPVGLEYLKATLESGFDVSAIIIEISKFAEKVKEYNLARTGDVGTPTTITEIIHNKKIPSYLVRKHRSKETIELLKFINPDIVIAGGVGGILKNDMLSIPSIGFIGSHPGLAPEVKGSNVVAHAIIDNKPVGATCFIMDEDIDTGDIIYQEKMSVYPGDSYEELENRMLHHASKVLSKGLKIIFSGKRDFIKQDSNDGHEYKANEDSVLLAKEMLNRVEYKHYSLEEA